jgi:hypothetical protein
LHLCRVDANGLVVYVSDGALAVAEGDADAITTTFHIIEAGTRLAGLPSWAALPWVHCLIYWAIRADSLPSITWGRQRKDLSDLIPRRVKDTAIDSLIRKVSNTMSATLPATTTLGCPFPDMPAWVFSNLIAPAVMTALAFMGVEIPFTLYVPRKT